LPCDPAWYSTDIWWVVAPSTATGPREQSTLEQHYALERVGKL
jgi:hypothetical protein